MLTVDVAPLREEFTRRRTAGEISPADVAWRLGWTRRQAGLTKADTSRVQRYLGLMPQVHHGNLYGTRVRVRYETAVLLADAIGVDPVDVGL